MKREPAKPKDIASAFKMLIPWNQYHIEMERWDGEWSVSIIRAQIDGCLIGSGRSDHLHEAIHKAIMQAREAIK